MIHLVGDIRAMAWEMANYGASVEEGRNRYISVARQAEYLSAWMREVVGLGSGTVVVGHDLGGGVAQILAARHPELVRGLMLTNSICYDSWPLPSVRAMRAMGPVIERLPDVVVRSNLYFRLYLRGHDDPERARESLEEHWPYLRKSGRRGNAGEAGSLSRRTRHAFRGGSHTGNRRTGTASLFIEVGQSYDQIVRVFGAFAARMDEWVGAAHAWNLLDVMIGRGSSAFPLERSR